MSAAIAILHSSFRPQPFWRTGVPTATRSADAVLVAFLLCQMLDGVFTYLGIVSFGPTAEGNPLMASFMSSIGYGVGLTVAKVFAALLGILLHFSGVHAIVAILTGIYVVASIVPWTAILFF